MSQIEPKKMAALTRMANGVIHELNNVLTVITLNGRFLMMHSENDSQMREDVEDILKAGERASNLIGQLSPFSSRNEMNVERIELLPFFNELKPALLEKSRTENQLKMTIAADVPNINADREGLKRVVLNVVANGFEAIDQNGNIALDVKPNPKGDGVLISTKDTGNGIEPAIQDAIFDPFFTTKKETGHKGLGLTAAYGLVTQMKGTFSIKSQPKKGTTVLISLPKA